MREQPLVSIGVPTYNRPGGLKKVLNALLSQDYQNIEVIVSDNCTPSDEVSKLKNELSVRDKRVQFYIQPENKGAKFNFRFVLEKATGDYFMWAADDDEWQGNFFLSSLMKYAPDNLLTFSEAAVIDYKNEHAHLLGKYERCETQFDYLKTFCTEGWGYPFYGLYNLKLFKKYDVKFEFDNDLVYYNEGTFIHSLFLSGPVKYVKEAVILFGELSSKPEIEVCIDNWAQYFKRTILLYSKSRLPEREKADLINIILNVYSAYSRTLYEDLISFENISGKQSLNRASENNSFFRKIASRLKGAYIYLLTGNP